MKKKRHPDSITARISPSRPSKETIGRKDILLAVLSGLILIFSFPRYGIGCLAWVALIPLYFSVEGKRPGQAFLLGWITGLVFYSGTIYWITYVIVHYGSLSFFIGILAMFLLSAYLALYFGLFAACAGYFKNGILPFIFTASAWWVCLEYIKSFLMTGFPWENLSHSQYLYGPVIQITDITGTFGLSFLIVVINTVLYEILSGRKPRKRVLMETAVAFSLLAITLGYGITRMQEIGKIQQQSVSHPVVLVQGNIEQDIKWNPQYQNETLEIYDNLTRTLQLPRGSLIVWPETAMPFFFQDSDEKSRRVSAIAKSSGNWLLFGSPSYIYTGFSNEYLNSAYLLSPDGWVAGQYSKVHLVPFGEYVPLRNIFPFLQEFAVGVGDFLPGKGYVPLVMKPIKLAVLICYEGILSEAGTEYKNQQADVIVNITNDAWFGRTAAPYQHLSMTVFRAVENRLYIVRAANTGISAIIDATGKIISHTSLFQRTTLSGTVRFMQVPVIYAVYGDVVVYICLIILTLCLIFRKRRQDI